MKDCTYQLTKAVYDRIVSSSIGYTITNGPRQNEEYPYISYGIVSSSPFMAKGNPGESVIIQFDTWSFGTNSDKETGDMLDKVLQSITVSQDVTPSMITTSSFWVVNQQLFAKNIVPDIDARMRHGVVQVEFTVQEKV